MGERIIRPGIRTSDRTAALVRDGGWMAQVFYDWLLTVVDDYGRYDARPAILRVTVFPLLLEMVREADVQRCLTACEKAGLVRLYAVDGKPFLELLDFRQRLRASKSKWPGPLSGDGGGEDLSRHCQDNATSMPTETDTETDTETPLAPQGGRRERSGRRRGSGGGRRDERRDRILRLAELPPSNGPETRTEARRA